MCVYLDDERSTPDGWVRAYWPDEAIALLESGQVVELSLDHDLGDDARGTGYDVVLWLEEAVALRGFVPPRMSVHSANASAREKMQAGIAAIERLARARAGAVADDALLAPVQAAIVDLDGTMVDTVGDFEQALARTLAELGLPSVDRAFIARTVGRGSMNLLRETLAHVGGAPDLLDAAWTHYQRHYADVNGTHADVYPGVVEGLAAMRARGWQLACVTNKPRAFALALLEAKGLRPFFAHVFGGDSFERHKPDPLPLLRTCEALGTTPARTLMVGDSRNDAEAARAAGCPVVLVGYGYNHGEPVIDARPDRVIERLDALG